MAEAVLSGLATEIAKTAGSSVFQKIRLLYGAKDELLRLKRTVQFIQAVLLDAEKQQWDNRQVKLWLGSLKEVLYDVQDLFDDVATEDLRRKVASGNKMSKEVRVFFSKSNQLVHRLKVANKIRELRKKLDEINNDKEQFGLETHLSGPSVAIQRRRTTHSFAREDEIIGREEDKKAIIARLLDSSSREGASVVSIVGIGGLGKTTLADLVYKDEKVKDCFQLKMWVCHGDPKIFDVDLIIKEILKSAKDECQGDPEMRRNLEGFENKNEEQSRRLLGKVLEGKKYLLILDDLWNEDRLRWLELRPLLMGGSSGSKILVTTRNKSVALATDVNSTIHELRGLSEDKSWELFKKMAFGDGEESLDSELEEIGRGIVTKCASVPLAIKTIGSLLYGKKEKNEWLNFKKRELPKIDKLDDGIMEVLKLSYDHLPSHLKHCFAYCALFPKDFVFDKQTMIQLWMAQGFIELLDENEDLEEAGDRYVSYLLQRSFLEVERDNHSTSEVEQFKMHDLMHDLASKVAGDECKMINCSEDSLERGIRHVSLASQPSLLQEWTSRPEATKLRTFLSLKDWSHKQGLSSNEWKEFFSKIRHCRYRTLVLPYADFLIPSSLGSRSKHLRFLDISRNKTIKFLPDSIADLVNLQTLKLSDCESLEALPRDLKKLVNLRHLLIDGCGSLTHMPPLSELPSLRELELWELPELEFVEEIRDPQQSNTFFPSLEKLHLYKCGKLKGWWGRRRVLVGEEQDHVRYDSQPSFPKLSYLQIRYCDNLKSLPLFPSVTHLQLLWSSIKWLEQQVVAVPDYSSEAALVSTSIPLSKLKNLYFYDILDLDHSMLETLLPFLRNLEDMTFHECSALRSLSSGMQYLSSLQHLFIGSCEELDLSSHDDEHGTQWRSLANLHILAINGLPKLMALPEGIQHVTTLQSLSIESCENLTSLPEWLGNFSLLQDLYIIRCPGIERLPDGMRNLTSLKRFRIFDCPALRRWCQIEDGADWEKIKGIAEILN